MKEIISIFILAAILILGERLSKTLFAKIVLLLIASIIYVIVNYLIGKLK